MPDLWVGLGSNLGQRREHLSMGLQTLAAHGATIRAVSSLYATAPQEITDQPEFLNAVARLTTTLPARAVLTVCRQAEAAAGRRRLVRFGPRSLDIDILFYDDVTIASEELEVPHPRLWHRAFVLAPLLELWPDLRAPDGRPARDILQQLTASQPVRVVGSGDWWKEEPHPA